MPFEIPQDKQQKELLSEINDSNSNIINSLHNQISTITNKLEQFNDNKSNNSSFGGLILLIVVIASIVFGWHFWDVPAQTNAINQYIYEKIIKDSSH